MSDPDFDALFRRAVLALWATRQFSTADIADVLVESEAAVVRVIDDAAGADAQSARQEVTL